MIRITGNTLAVEGPMTVATARALLAEGQPGEGAWVVDLSAVTHADSSGLAVLLDWLRVSRRAGGSLRFEAMPESLQSLARLYGIDAMLADPLASAI
ncbi:MAG: STAS domain-containing protein [Rhodocyclaceae bacterium]|jgi:phospholipid transport system transporter-binding protein|nr:STAS domain-containing protein [Rhodocyclaceae bacterium]